jgi:hypothetical protein
MLKLFPAVVMKFLTGQQKMQLTEHRLFPCLKIKSYLPENSDRFSFCLTQNNKCVRLQRIVFQVENQVIIPDDPRYRDVGTKV